MSRDLTRIYTGEQWVHILEMQNGQYVNIEKANMNVENFVDIKLMKDDSVLIWEEETADLVKYDRYMVE